MDLGHEMKAQLRRRRGLSVRAPQWSGPHRHSGDGMTAGNHEQIDSLRTRMQPRTGDKGGDLQPTILRLNAFEVGGAWRIDPRPPGEYSAIGQDRDRIRHQSYRGHGRVDLHRQKHTAPRACIKSHGPRGDSQAIRNVRLGHGCAEQDAFAKYRRTPTGIDRSHARGMKRATRQHTAQRDDQRQCPIRRRITGSLVAHSVAPKAQTLLAAFPPGCDRRDYRSEVTAPRAAPPDQSRRERAPL